MGLRVRALPAEPSGVVPYEKFGTIRCGGPLVGVVVAVEDGERHGCNYG